MAQGPKAGLEVLEAAAPELEGYHLLHAVRGDLLKKLGRHQEAKTEFEQAANLTKNAREKAIMRQRSAAADRATNAG
jgi:predicted RNA polymerase sigma factor